MKRQQRVSDLSTLEKLRKRFPGKMIDQVDSSDKAYYIRFIGGDSIAIMRREIDNDRGNLRHDR